MPDVLQDIRDWLHQQQDWLQEAAENLLSAGSLTELEVQAIADRSKTSDGQQITVHRTFDGLATAPVLAAEIRLVEIGPVSGIENLDPRTPLGFGTGNLAVIYGNNGSGKSAYTRILKRACGTPRAAELKPNVFHAAPATRECRITYRKAGTDCSVDWQATGAPIDDIRAVDIFDADAAVLYLNQEAAVSYIPSSVALFEALAVVCDRIKGRLQDEQDHLLSKLPILPPEYANTLAGVAYRALKPDLAEDAIQSLTKWTDEDQDTLTKVTERLRTEDLVALARKKRNTKSQLDQLVVLLRNAATAFGPQNVEAIRQARLEAHTKRRAASESAQVGSGKLDGIGTDTWNALWQAARAYSQIAYSAQDFPFTADGARCVLCQQELALDAQQRLRDFEAFVQGAVEADAKKAETVLKSALAGLPAILDEEGIRTRCEAAGLTDDSWANRLGMFWKTASTTRARLLDGETEAKADPAESPDDALKDLTQRGDALERDALQHDEDAKSFDRDSIGKSKLSLEAQHWTSQQGDAIRLEITRLQSMKEYEDWKRLANSRSVSMKAGELSERVITQAYVDRFNRELNALGASRIKIELIKTRIEKGIALHKLRLSGVHRGQDVPEAVLSEGERRIVALAAFLADVAEKPHPATFIFDDPISSLDQDFEWCVAMRLVQLAQSRQVLVFTHRLSLYGAMEDASKKFGEEWKKEHLEQRSIESFHDVVGHPADQLIMTANTKKANNILLSRLDDAKKAGETDGADAYRIHAQAICTEFRKLLERTVEDDLLNQIVKRHRRSVTTDNRLVRLPSISHDDCKFIDGLMTKYSCYEHSQSQEMPTFLPDETELRRDLEALRLWRDTFTQRPINTAA